MLRAAVARAGFMLCLLPLLVPGCVVPDVDLEGRPCPCADGWICDTTTNVCVRSDVGMPDGATDTGPVMDSRVSDGSVPDGSTDSRPDGTLDACTTVPVTESWGDHAGSDHPGTVLDTWINLNRERHASDDGLLLYTWPTAQVANAIVMKWDLAAIPSGAVVTDAVLHLHQWEAVGATYRTTAHRIEGCDPDIAGDAVDGYQCSVSRDWTANACCYDGVPMGQADIGAVEDTQALDAAAGNKSWNVTAMVQAWVDDPATNRGLMINSDRIAAADDRRSFRSSEHPTAAERPRLEVTYTSCD